MGQGEDSRRPQGCPEVEAWWPATRRRRQHLLFYWANKWAPVHISTNRIFFASSAVTSGSLLSDSKSNRFNSRSVRIAKNYPKNRGFLRLKRKVMVFRNFAFNIVVLCYLPTRRLTSIDGSEPPAATSFLQVGPACRNHC
jgi:hypothetical protein